MKYMVMVFGEQATVMETRSQEWIRSMFEFMNTINDELRESGELLNAHGLADPPQAKTVRIQNGVPVATDGPFAEAKESLAGFWILETDEERALEVASRVVAFIEEPVEVRQVMDEAPELPEI